MRGKGEERPRSNMPDLCFILPPHEGTRLTGFGTAYVYSNPYICPPKLGAWPRDMYVSLCRIQTL